MIFLQGIKRGRSPSPPPTAVSMYQGYPKYPSSNYSTPPLVKQEPQYNQQSKTIKEL